MANKRSTLRMLTIITLIVCFFIAACKDGAVDSPPVQLPQEKKWEAVPLFQNADIRYMVKHREKLYVSAVYHLGAKDSSVIFTTVDGEKWDTVKIFLRDIGPIVFIGDTLIVLETGRIWRYHKSFGWEILYETVIGAWLTRDMIYLNKELFIFENRYYSYSKNRVREIIASDVVSKFVKQQVNGEEIAYTMPYYVYLGEPRAFNGYEFYSIGNSNHDNKTPNYPALYVHNDTLYAAFNTPTRIKKLINNFWIPVTDSIKNPSNASLFNPPLTNTASSILFYQNRMFVGTERTGVLEWSDSGWVSISNGLQKQFYNQLNIEIFTPIIFLESLNGILFTGYGEPGFAPLHNGKGMYKYKLN